MDYNWVKAVHVLAVISWMAGMLYLPRLFVYHSGVAVGSEADQTFKVMERRLLRAIMLPAMIVALLTGGHMLFAAGFGLTTPWVVVKLLSVLGMLAVHGMLSRHRRNFEQGLRTHSGKYFRVLNEVPTVLMVVIVIAVVVKPWG